MISQDRGTTSDKSVSKPLATATDDDRLQPLRHVGLLVVFTKIAALFRLAGDRTSNRTKNERAAQDSKRSNRHVLLLVGYFLAGLTRGN